MNTKIDKKRINQNCEKCNHLNSIKNEYNLQFCKKCGAEILPNNRNIRLLIKICDHCACALTIRPNESVLFGDYVDAEFKNVTDALIYFYVDFLKEYWTNKEDLELIENLIEDKALNIVLSWLDSYSYSLMSKSRSGRYLNLKVKDLDCNDLDCEITEHSLDYWCEYFIEEIYNKNVEEEVRKEWIKEDVEPMKLYLNRNKCMDVSSREELDNTCKNKESRTVKFEMKYNIDLNLEFKDDVYIITSKFPLALMINNRILECANEFHFTKLEDEYVLKLVKTINDDIVYSRHIISFLNIDTTEFFRVCSELCESYVTSYIKVDNKFYEIKSIVDFLKINDLDEVAVSKMDYNFEIEEKKLLHDIMSHCHESNFKEVLKNLNDKIIFNKEIIAVARIYAKKVLRLNDTQLKYMDYLNYFESEVFFKIIDGYVVVYI